MLNSTKVLRYIEKKLGYKFTDLEVDEEEILEDIRMYTLKEYSKYFPYIKLVNITECHTVDDKCNRIFVDSKGLEILSVNRILDGNNMMYMDPSIMLRDTFVCDIFSQIELSDMYSMIKNPVTFRYFPPNVIEIYPAVVGMVDCSVYVNCVHPDHFGTIAANMEPEFLKLAVLDVKDSLYQIRHRFSNLETPYGSIELFIDDLSEAESKKEDLLEKWSTQYGKQANRKRLYIF